jgi:putative addiction module component (TIGR02574 family)
MSEPIRSVFELSPAEKLQLVEDLWDDLAAVPEDVPLHDWQREELQRRRARFQLDPGNVLSWEDVKRRVRGYARGTLQRR